MASRKQGNGDTITGFPYNAPCNGSWKLILPCNREEAQALAEGEIGGFILMDEPPVIMVSEPDPNLPENWRLEAYFDREPDGTLVAMLRDLVPSASHLQPVIEHIEEQDWVVLSQSGLEPVRAGRFLVCTPANIIPAEKGLKAFTIDAGRAFGTGHHETTTGCLMMLDKLKRQGQHFSNIADIGTGTGLLAFASRYLWQSAKVIASDLDPVAIEVAKENAVINSIPMGRGRCQVEMVIAAGLAHRRLQQRAPYDLLIANILAGPLIELADSFVPALASGGCLILAGLVKEQEKAVCRAYQRLGMRLADRVVLGDWPSLLLVKRPNF
ncbi:50S ribosomal protein L11 methyltransferase [Zymomonas mobilis]|uniref:Ribosomal protein L11 methyltransferase n=1 Tax=Zymomonas mobilis subsp. pomaceae (strain ATCC 29192 / DSM 22645 / JCM 10191 / CCUG 17912 / NBRC 13757 / NCIMB 11200 / NRRL B-4491 / Barker I) TaxID=579138 RepID=F8ERU1_ZYMMT|nr:50S ribosomal protein L11 methyltransferase [Zymomonas mobilis]AEI37549.1 ribosomal L11 methyltransferase [Zymomonas mobilis subsp. pomaceae ATCC 29192]MDX5948917.1 50S ribosomal protein L11 methyltransferase [Zymomonas mobilis subsp. pomaceae]GEB88723.1 ribosomal protein L11 methyltransferase [Zymomonas mobilis subsp. pomaceae]